jgi:hypothetical protein
MIQYSVAVSIPDPGTLRELSGSGYRLQAYRAVCTTDLRARPLLWKVADRSALAPHMRVTWSAGLSGFASTSQLSPGQQVLPASYAAADPGQTVVVTDGALTTTEHGGRPGYIRIVSQSGTAYLCGLLSSAGDAPPAPFCVLPLGSGVLQEIRAVPVVLLNFSTDPTPPGTVVRDDQVGVQAVTAGFRICLADASERTVMYSGGGWATSDGGTWGQPVGVRTRIVPELVITDPARCPCPG